MKTLRKESVKEQTKSGYQALLEKGMKKGMEKGVETQKRKTVKKMILDHLSDEVIMDYADATKEYVQAVREELLLK